MFIRKSDYNFDRHATEYLENYFQNKEFKLIKINGWIDCGY